MASSRLSGFYKLPLAERRATIARSAKVDLPELESIVASGGLPPAAADKIVENVLGIYSLPFGVGLNFTINGADVLVPMVVEEPSVIAAASNAARMVRAAGGFTATTVEALMTAQVQLFDVQDPHHACAQLEAHRDELIAIGNEAVPNLIRRQGGVRELEVRDLGRGVIVIHAHVDCRDAMGANLVNCIAEAIGPRAADVAGGKLGLRILTNLCDRRRVHVSARVHARDLASPSIPETDTQAIVDAIAQASLFAELDPYRAATHNKGIMNGIDSVVIATGNDARATEAGAHAYAARSGQYRPLAVWKREGNDLVGEMELPLALGTVGGTLRVHPAARLALELCGAPTADALARIAAAAGLASNLAALRALATEGISRGHMSLHARSVACAAGAEGDEVEVVAARLSQCGKITVDKAGELLAELRASTHAS